LISTALSPLTSIAIFSIPSRVISTSSSSESTVSGLSITPTEDRAKDRLSSVPSVTPVANSTSKLPVSWLSSSMSAIEPKSSRFTEPFFASTIYFSASTIPVASNVLVILLSLYIDIF